MPRIAFKIRVKTKSKVISDVIRDRASSALTDYLKVLKRRMLMFSPRETGALDSGHFARKIRKLEAIAGFEFNAAQRARNIANKVPPDFFYGAFLHSGATAWTPRAKGTGPGWLLRALRSTARERVQIFRNAIGGESTGFEFTAAV